MASGLGMARDRLADVDVRRVDRVTLALVIVASAMTLTAAHATGRLDLMGPFVWLTTVVSTAASIIVLVVRLSRRRSAAAFEDELRNAGPS